MTTTHVPDDPSPGPDASDVVTGPVGSASLRDPASSGPQGADLDQLPTIDPPSAGAGDTAQKDRPTEPGSADAGDPSSR